MDLWQRRIKDLAAHLIRILHAGMDPRLVLDVHIGDISKEACKINLLEEGLVTLDASDMLASLAFWEYLVTEELEPDSLLSGQHAICSFILGPKVLKVGNITCESYQLLARSK